MNYYNSMSSGPSSRPYNPQSYTHPAGSSSNTQSSLSPSFPSYPLMTDLPPAPSYHHPHQQHSTVGHDEDEDAEDQDQGQEQEQEQDHEQDQEQRSMIEVDDSAPLVEPHQDLDSFLESFWTRQMAVVERDNPDFRTYPLPLARIKKVMKSDEEVKMISAEVPIMFSKACEVFISELTCRAWLIAESNKRRTLQKADVANAIAHSDMFDFLIDIVPRDDGTGGSANGGGSAGAGSGGGGVDLGEAGAGGGEGDYVVDQNQGRDEQDEEDRVFTEFVRDDED